MMLEPESHNRLRCAIKERLAADAALLKRLREEVRPLRQEVRRIQPRTATSISLVTTDGGNNRVHFDPFLVQLIRVVDSSNNEYCLEAVTPTTSVTRLSASQFEKDGTPQTPIGHLMKYLDLRDLTELSHMIRRNDDDRPSSPSWVQVYRELMEWAILFAIIRTKDFATDTLIVCDGLLRSKVFATDKFRRLLSGLKEGIDLQWNRHKRRIWLVGLAKHSSVLSRYRLALALEGILTSDFPAYVSIPRELEERTYVWSEYARGDDRALEGGEINRFVGGKMFFAKFGRNKRDPIWPVDVFLPQQQDAQVVLGHLLADAENGFPTPFYPRCLQKAHEHAALVDFDFELLQDEILDGVRDLLASEAPALDAFRLQDPDPSRLRYQ